MADENRIEATHTKTDRTVGITYPLGKNLQEMVKLFGEEVVASNAKQAITISAQARIRRMLDVKDGEKQPTDAEVQKAFEDWKPGVASQTRKSPAEKAKEALDKLSPEDRKALLAQLKG